MSRERYIAARIDIDKKKLRKKDPGSDCAQIMKKKEIYAKAYEYGCRTNWNDPNSTDVKTVFKVDSLSAYLAKYLAKDMAKDGSSRMMKKRLKSFGGRLWYCSRSLSKLKSYSTVFCNDYHSYLTNLTESMLVRVKEFDYCTNLYFSIRDMPKELKKIFNTLMGKYINSQWEPVGMTW